MTDDKKHDDNKRNGDKDRKKLSDEELEDVAGGMELNQTEAGTAHSVVERKGKKNFRIGNKDGFG